MGRVWESSCGKSRSATETPSSRLSLNCDICHEIHIAAPVSHRRRRQLTRDEKGASAPAFSPDGRYVYFTSARPDKMNVFRILIEGGEAERITDFKGSLGAFKISPDGKWVAFAG